MLMSPISTLSRRKDNFLCFLMVPDQGRSGSVQECLITHFPQFRPDVQEIQPGTSVAAFCAFAKDVVGASSAHFLDLQVE